MYSKNMITLNNNLNILLSDCMHTYLTISLAFHKNQWAYAIVLEIQTHFQPCVSKNFVKVCGYQLSRVVPELHKHVVVKCLTDHDCVLQLLWLCGANDRVFPV